jgi:DNA-binding PadR family transcriptional regulator
MKTQDVLGPLEQLVLTAVMDVGPEAYASAIRKRAAELSGRKVTFGSVFITLDRLEDKGYVASKQGTPSSNGGRPKRYYRMRAAGERVLSEAFKTSNLLQQTAESKFQFIKWKTQNLQDPIPESDG